MIGRPPTATSALVEFTGKCLEFKTQSKPDVNVPIEVVNAPADPNAFDELAQAYKKNQTQIRQVQKQQFKWGSFYHWSTVGKEPSHYIFLSTVNKKLTVRIGPIPNSVKSLYKLNWSLKPWQ